MKVRALRERERERAEGERSWGERLTPPPSSSSIHTVFDPQSLLYVVNNAEFACIVTSSHYIEKVRSLSAGWPCLPPFPFSSFVSLFVRLLCSVSIYSLESSLPSLSHTHTHTSYTHRQTHTQSLTLITCLLTSLSLCWIAAPPSCSWSKWTRSRLRQTRNEPTE